MSIRDAIRIIRLEELLDDLETVQDNIDSLDPPQTKKYKEGFQAGLNVAMKLAEVNSYEALEYDTMNEHPTAN